MINDIINDLQKIIEASRIEDTTQALPYPLIQWFNFSRLEDFELHSEVIYPICLVNVRTASAQIEGTIKSYDINLMCLEPLPQKEYDDTDNSYQKKIDDKLELFKKFIQHVCYFLTSTDYAFYYTLERDLIEFNDEVDFTEWALIGVESTFTISTNTSGFVCDLIFEL